jgi:hypothetical protein
LLFVFGASHHFASAANQSAAPRRMHVSQDPRLFLHLRADPMATAAGQHDHRPSNWTKFVEDFTLWTRPSPYEHVVL